MDIVRILAVCFLAAVFAVLLRQYRPEYALTVTTAACAAVLIMLLSGLYAPVQALRGLLSRGGIGADTFSTALKALGIAYITGFIADICRESGQTALASKAELAGKCAIFILSLPLLASILETALGFIE